jgi:hypothetical protein
MLAILEHLKAAWSEAVEQAKEWRECALDRAKATVERVWPEPGSLADSMLADEFQRGRRVGMKQAIDLLNERGFRGAASELHGFWVKL